jgi:hypothetical protein
MNTNMLITLAMERTCPAGLPHTGSNPEEDHGHTDCWIYHRLIAKITELQEENAELVNVLMGPYVNVNESKVEQVDELLATHIGRSEKEALEALIAAQKHESHEFSGIWWEGLI